MPRDSNATSTRLDHFYPVPSHVDPNYSVDLLPYPTASRTSDLPSFPNSPTTQSSSTQKKKHVCATCGRSFTTSGHLARHSRVHTGERNHQCPFPGCQTRCSRQDNLQQHYRIHLSPGSRRGSGAATRAAIKAMTQNGDPSESAKKHKVGKRKSYNPKPPIAPPSPPLIEPARPSPPNTPPPLAPARYIGPLPPTYAYSHHSRSNSSASSAASSSPELSLPSRQGHGHQRFPSIDSASVVLHSPQALAPIQPPTDSFRSGAVSYQQQSEAASNGGYVDYGTPTQAANDGVEPYPVQHAAAMEEHQHQQYVYTEVEAQAQAQAIAHVSGQQAPTVAHNHHPAYSQSQPAQLLDHHVLTASPQISVSQPQYVQMQDSVHAPSPPPPPLAPALVHQSSRSSSRYSISHISHPNGHVYARSSASNSPSPPSTSHSISPRISRPHTPAYASHCASPAVPVTGLTRTSSLDLNAPAPDGSYSGFYHSDSSLQGALPSLSYGYQEQQYASSLPPSVIGLGSRNRYDDSPPPVLAPIHDDKAVRRDSVQSTQSTQSAHSSYAYLEPPSHSHMYQEPYHYVQEPYLHHPQPIMPAQAYQPPAPISLAHGSWRRESRGTVV